MRVLRPSANDFLHVRVDDASRLAFLPSERKKDATALPEPALAWLARQGAGVQRVMIDNGSAHRSKLSAKALQAARARYVRPRSYTPRNHGKAERFIQPSLREWAKVRP